METEKVKKIIENNIRKQGNITHLAKGLPKGYCLFKIPTKEWDFSEYRIETSDEVVFTEEYGIWIKPRDAAKCIVEHFFNKTA
jgi:hypothetical protein